MSARRPPLAKRVLDRGGGAVLTVLASPLIAVSAGAIALDHLRHPSSRGRWFVRDRRISAGAEFDLLKFRVLKEDVMRACEAEGGNPRLLEADAANLTPSGALLKRWYLDELPQLLNVLRGEMSLVGPRPWPVWMVEAQVARGLDYRLRVPAGWTGAAQASKGEATMEFDRRDLEYVDAYERLSGPALAALDLRLLGRTVRTMLRGEGLQY